MPFSIDNIKGHVIKSSAEEDTKVLKYLRELKASKEAITGYQKARLEQLEKQEAKIKNVGLKQQPSIFNNQDAKNTMKGFSSIFNNKE